jgi:hypothetical protein
MVARRHVAAALAALVVLVSAGCGGASDDGRETPTGNGASISASPPETWDLVVLADSSGWGLADAWAELIRRDEGVEVRVHDFAVGMQSGSLLLKHLRTEGDPQRDAVRDAEVISVWGGPTGLVWRSDIGDCFLYPDGTRPPTRISRRDMEPFAELWRDILSEITYLRNGRPTALRTRDLYVPVISNYVRAGTAEACVEGLATQSDIVRDATRQAGGTFVAVNRAFNGPDGMRDPRQHGMLQDMEHLSDKGVALMARVHHAAGYAELTRGDAASE